MAKHGPHMILHFGSSWILIKVPRNVPCKISHCWVYPLVPFPNNGQNMALLWPKYGPHKILQIGYYWILIKVPKNVPCKISHCLVYPVAPSSRKGKNVHLLAKNGHHMVLQMGSSWIIINVPWDAPCQISRFWVYPIIPFSQKWPKYGPFMAKTWSSHGPLNQLFLNHNQCAQGCSMPNFTILDVSHSPLFLEMVEIWPFYGQKMVLTWSFKLVPPES